MARRVLVEQRVVEDGAERADAALAVDERDLATSARRRPRPSLIGAPRRPSRRRSRRRRRPRTWISIPSIIVPSVRTSGRVERTTPSARSGSGVVVSSSDGRFGTIPPSTVVSLAFCQSDVGRRPIVRSVPGPSKWTASSAARSAVRRRRRSARRARHALSDLPRRAARRARSPPEAAQRVVRIRIHLSRPAPLGPASEPVGCAR